jgi:uncharacterized protein YprB with RNaseH-like and TPR domain
MGPSRRSGADPGELPGPDWIPAGFKTAKRSVLRSLPHVPPFPFPRDLPVLIPDLLRYGPGDPDRGSFSPPDPGDLLFFDLETTGLSGGAGTVAFLAAFGRLVPADPGEKPAYLLRVDQYLLLDYPGEPNFLEALLPEFRETGGVSPRPPLVVSYNGKSFDAQILKTRCVMNGLRPPASCHADLLHPARRLWRGTLPSCSQGAIETAVLGLDRTGDIPGALAPEIWFSFLRSGGAGGLLAVCDHNLRDVVGLACLFSVIGYIAGDPLGLWESYGVNIESLALGWREFSRRFPGIGGAETEKTAGTLLRAAADQGRPRARYLLGKDLLRQGRGDEGRALLRRLARGTAPAGLRAAAYRVLAIDAEWGLRKSGAALGYVEEALALDPGILEKDFLHRRKRLLARKRMETE